MIAVALILAVLLNGCVFAKYNKYDVVDGKKVLVGKETLSCWGGSCARGDMNATASARVPDLLPIR